MERLTTLLQKCADQPMYGVSAQAIQATDQGYAGEAIQKLAKFENLQANLLQKQEAISAELAKLHQIGTKKTVKFQELMMQKHTNAGILRLLQAYGL